jgi:hypothetical protein
VLPVVVVGRVQSWWSCAPSKESMFDEPKNEIH